MEDHRSGPSGEDRRTGGPGTWGTPVVPAGPGALRGSGPAPMDRAPADPSAPVAGPGEWPRPAPHLAASEVPAHVALVMDGNGRWANSRGRTRTEGHRAGEYALMDTVAGAIDAGVRYLSVYTFSTENWKRSPAEVRFIMSYASDVLRRRTAQLDEWGVHVRWSGREPRLWKSVIHALRQAEATTRHNDTLDLVMCVNYEGLSLIHI